MIDFYVVAFSKTLFLSLLDLNYKAILTYDFTFVYKKISLFIKFLLSFGHKTRNHYSLPNVEFSFAIDRERTIFPTLNISLLYFLAI